MIKRVDGPTPNGGKYSLLYFYNDEGKSVEEKDATKCIASEYDENDKLICESFLTKSKENDITQEEIEILN